VSDDDWDCFSPQLSARIWDRQCPNRRTLRDYEQQRHELGLRVAVHACHSAGFVVALQEFATLWSLDSEHVVEMEVCSPDWPETRAQWDRDHPEGRTWTEALNR
jgi:hypothetical protein